MKQLQDQQQKLQDILDRFIEQCRSLGNTTNANGNSITNNTTDNSTTDNSTNNITNNTTNNYNITVNPFGQENWNYMTDAIPSLEQDIQEQGHPKTCPSAWRTCGTDTPGRRVRWGRLHGASPTECCTKWSHTSTPTSANTISCVPGTLMTLFWQKTLHTGSHQKLG